MKVCAFGLGPRVACGFLILCTVLFATTAPSTVRAAGVVGTGTAASCTDAALNTALAGGGLVTFNCGPAPVTIDISTGTGSKFINADTTIDGGGLITISGGQATVIDGGAISNSASLTVSNIGFAGNRSASLCIPFDFCYGGNGGAISNSGTLNVVNSTFSGNGASGDGGGIFNSDYGSTLTVTNSTFSDNGAYIGGAISNYGTLTVTNSTFSGNTSVINGGGIYNYAYDDTLTVTNSTFSGNGAGYYGGGIYNAAGTLTVTNCTFAGNSAGGGSGIAAWVPATLTNTIVAQSARGDNCYSIAISSDGGHIIDSGHNITDGGHNIDDGTSCGFSAANGSVSNTNAQLDPAGLQDNGGPTQTVALCKGIGVPVGCTAASPAIDAGDQAVCAAPPVNNLDQRGLMRPGTGHTNCSIGAYEADAPYCGNGQVEPGEQCDDGNSVNGDCCSSTCQFEPLNSPCNDHNLCTTGDFCNGAGVCSGFTACKTGKPCNFCGSQCTQSQSGVCKCG